MRHYAFPSVEIIAPEKNSFFDYDAKYGGATQEICPSSFSMSVKREMENTAIAAHKALGLRHYSRADFIVSPRGVYLLEINSLPGLTEESLLPKACKSIGLSFSGFLEHALRLAL